MRLKMMSIYLQKTPHPSRAMMTPVCYEVCKTNKRIQPGFQDCSVAEYTYMKLTHVNTYYNISASSRGCSLFTVARC